MMLLGAIVCGFLLDLAIGDPHGWPHPIILIGNLISWLEKRVRAVSGTDPDKLLRGGFVLVLVVCFLSFSVPYLILLAAGKVHPWLRFAIETIMCYQIFCTRSLRDESMKVYDALEAHPEVDMCAHAATVIKQGKKIGNIAPRKECCIIPTPDVILGGGSFFATNSLFYRKIMRDTVPNFYNQLGFHCAVFV